MDFENDADDVNAPLLQELANKPSISDDDDDNGKESKYKLRINATSFSSHVALGMYWFGWFFLWLPLLVVIIPLQVFNMVGDASKGTSLSTTYLLGAVCSLLAPIFGQMSDDCTHRWGRRRPFMVAGTIISTFCLFSMALSQSMGSFSLAFIVLSVATNIILTPCSALLPDVVPAEKVGVASGWIGGMSMLGSLCGGILSYQVDRLGLFWSYMICIVVHGVSAAITCYYVKETPLKESEISITSCEGRINSYLSPFYNYDFKIVFGTRFLMQMGILTVLQYLQYYMKDAIGPHYVLRGRTIADTPEKAVAVLLFCVLLGAIISSLFSGVLSDWYGGRRKIIVYISSGIMSFACILFSITRNFSIDMVVGFIFGLGYGSFSVIDWAMATDVLPNEREFAKDMGIWSLAMALPQMIAAPVAGNILDYFEKVAPNLHVGYSTIFILSVFYLAGGAYYVQYVTKVK